MNKPFRRQFEYLSINQEGAAALMTVIVLTALIALIGTSISFQGISDATLGFAGQMGTTTILGAESCGEEALVRIVRNPNYSGGNLTVGDVSCTISITGNPCGNCTIDVEAVDDRFTRDLRIVMNRTGSTIDIISWEEL